MSSPIEEKDPIFTLGDVVFDTTPHSMETKDRLNSAADFVLKYEFDNENQLRSLDCMKNFLGAKLMCLNMILLEDAIAKTFPDGNYSDEELKFVVEEHLKQKDEANKRAGERTHPERTEISEDMIENGLKVEYLTTPTSYECDICQLDPIGPCDTHWIAKMANCRHGFHLRCIKKWLVQGDHHQCPKCRRWALLPQFEYPKWIWESDMLRLFLQRDHNQGLAVGGDNEARYRNSVLVLHRTVSKYLVTLGRGDISSAFLRQVPVIMEAEAETRIEEKEKIKEEVSDFLQFCCNFGPGREDLFNRFNEFTSVMLEALRVDAKLREEFEEEVENKQWDDDDVRSFAVVLSNLLRGVAYGSE